MLLVKYFNKNSEIGIGLNFGLNSYPTNEMEYPLTKLLKSKYLNKEFLQFFLNLFVKCKIGLKKEIYDKAMQICQNNKNFKQFVEYKSMIQQTFEKVKDFDFPH